MYSVIPESLYESYPRCILIYYKLKGGYSYCNIAIYLNVCKTSNLNFKRERERSVEQKEKKKGKDVNC